MMDDKDDVMLTFSDYSEENPIRFIQSAVSEEHPWCGSALKDIQMPPDTIVAVLQRAGEKIIPNGSTVLLAGDLLVLCAESSAEVEGIRLSERKIKEGDSWLGKALSDTATAEGQLILMIQRSGQIIIPNGDTVLEENDLLVINHFI